MYSAACIELPKLPDDLDGWKIQPALHDITGWMHASKNNACPFVLPFLSTLTPSFIKEHFNIKLSSGKVGTCRKIVSSWWEDWYSTERAEPHSCIWRWGGLEPFHRWRCPQTWRRCKSLEVAARSCRTEIEVKMSLLAAESFPEIAILNQCFF